MKLQTIAILLIALFALTLACDASQIVGGIVGSKTATSIPQAFITILPPPIPAADAIATDVARAQAVAATLTAAAPKPSANTPVPSQPTIPPGLPTIIAGVQTPSGFPTIEVIYSTPATAAYAMLVNQHTQKCLTAQGNSAVQATCVASSTQLWQSQGGNGPFQFVSSSGGCLAASGNRIALSNCAGSPAWTLRQWGNYWAIQNARLAAKKEPHPHVNPTPLELGNYFQFMDGGNCVDVDGWNHNEGGDVMYWPCNGDSLENANQLWAFYRR